MRVLVILQTLTFLGSIHLHAEEYTLEEKRKEIQVIVDDLLDNSPVLKEFHPVVDLIPTPEGSSLKNPAVFITNGTNFITTIRLEERVFDLCLSFGEDNLQNALSFIIAHELAHFRLEHHWTLRFRKEHLGCADTREFANELSYNSRQSSMRKYQETQADHLALVDCYFTGYNASDIAPQVLEKIYDEYEIGSTNDNYPTLSERKAIASEASDRFRRMAEIYRYAIYAMIAGDYESATETFALLIRRKFDNHQVINAYGVCKAMLAQQVATDFFADQINQTPLRFTLRYPFSISLSLREKSGTRGAQEFNALLDQAEDAFVLAKTKGANDRDFHTNMAIISMMKESRIDSDYHINKLKVLGQQNDLDTRMLGALNSALNENKELAVQALANLVEEEHLLSGHNLALLQSKTLEASTKEITLEATQLSKIQINGREFRLNAQLPLRLTPFWNFEFNFGKISSPSLNVLSSESQQVYEFNDMGQGVNVAIAYSELSSAVETAIQEFPQAPTSVFSFAEGRISAFPLTLNNSYLNYKNAVLIEVDYHSGFEKKLILFFEGWN